MIPARVRVRACRFGRSAVALITEHGDDAKFIAGGMSLIPLMKLRLATPTVLVDVGRLHDLSYVRDDGEHDRDRRAHASPRCSRPMPGSRRVAVRCSRRRTGRRQPGPPPRHDRRLGRARRPRVRSSGRVARPRRRVRRARTAAASARFRRRSSSKASSRPRSLPTSCSSRSAFRRPGATASRTRSSTGGRRTGRSSARSRCAPTDRCASASSTWDRHHCARPRWSRHSRVVHRPTMPPSRRTPGPSPRPTSTCRSSTGATRGGLVRRALEAAV